MKKLVLTVLILTSFINLNAQEVKSNSNTNSQTNKLTEPTINTPVSLAGPRLGFTVLTPGELSDELDANFITQYGWQWESRFADGEKVVGLVEWIVLVAGMEQGMFLPSVSSLVGVRNYQGFEFAAGPNLSASGLGMVLAVGVNYKIGNLNLPINFAFVPSNKSGMWGDGDKPTGARFSVMVGFNMRKSN
jgi:hypothetical protein